MDLRTTFNKDEYNYDKTRPDYPSELFEDIFDYANLCSSSIVLEIGIGTGQATLPFLQRGLNLTAVELQPLIKFLPLLYHKLNELGCFITLIAVCK